ncbi:hypothetical protein [Streptomyces sp. NPDC051776]|uniref:hypothetical protein n=1 Tax=Streptomyces sp. NPDC051776 TaxID=3155414 RepID=UPI003412118D
MSLPDRKQEEVRRMLDGPHPVVPPDLAELAAMRGRQLLARHRIVRAVTWTVLVVAVVAFAVWAIAVQPWVMPPSGTTPPLEGW